ncbi:MAG: UDP-galactopyranose mutase, partial [Acidobacteriaceae bacterium]|nr:UDP-galactopyranose mutase [Acidobacteriaceae bacterium]
GVHFVGRLATYKYYNMDQVTAQALSLFNRLRVALPVRPAADRRRMLYPPERRTGVPAAVVRKYSGEEQAA